DGTTFLSQHHDKVKKMLGDLQSIYDGDFTKATGTGEDSPLLSFKSKFSSIWCATPDALGAHQRYLEQIGPRFLAVRVPPLTPQQKHKGYELSRSSDRKALEETFKKAVQDRLRTVLSPAADLVGAVEIPDPVEQWLEKLAEMIAAGRTPLRWEGS